MTTSLNVIVRPLLVALLLTAALPAVPAAASSDHRQAVDITFPLTADVEVSYRRDYDDCRRSDAAGCVRHHQATDLMVAPATPVHAARGGVVTWRSGSEAGPPSYGWMLHIEGDDGREYAYIHLGFQDQPMGTAYAPGTERGQRVARGQLIGWAGCSGSASCGGGEHLHFEIHDSSVIDPYDYHDHERIDPYLSLVSAQERGDYPDSDASDPFTRFTDVATTHTHAADIAWLAEVGVTRGCGPDRFCPEDPVSREQMASFLVRAIDLPAAPTSAGFVDVVADGVHAADIASLWAARVTKGCGGDRFCPTDVVTRAQMASFLVRGFDLDGGVESRFSDVPDSNPHLADIDTLAETGVTRGCGGTTFCPDRPVTRAEMASFLRRAMELTSRM